MSIKSVVSALSLALLAPIAVAADLAAGVVTMPGKAVVLGGVKLTATVSAVDAATRTVTIKAKDGTERQVVAGPEVRNFAQIAVGDEVVAEFAEALSLELMKGGAGIRERTDSADAVRAAEGDKPGVAAAKKTVVIADVVKVDKKNSVVTVKGVKKSMQLKIADPEQLKLIAVGDQIKGTYVEAVGLSIQKAK